MTTPRANIIVLCISRSPVISATRHPLFTNHRMLLRQSLTRRAKTASLSPWSRWVGNKRRSSVSLADQASIPSIPINIDNKPDFKIERYSPSKPEEPPSVESFDEPTGRMHGQSAVTLPAGVMPTVPLASVPPHFPYTTKSTMGPYSGFDAVRRA